MLEYKLEPKSVEGMVGHVIIRVPSMKERLVLLKEAGISGKGDESNIDALIGMVDKVSLYVKEVDLCLDELEFKDIESLGHYESGMKIYTEIAQVIMNGIPAGKR